MMMYVNVEVKNDYIVSYTPKGKLIASERGIVFDSSIDEIISGYIVIKDQIKKYSCDPPVKKIVKGIPHLLVAFDDDGGPVYAVKIRNNYYVTKDFRSYMTARNVYSFAEISKLYDKYNRFERYKTIIVDGKIYDTIVDYESNTARLFYPLDVAAAKIEVPFAVIDERGEFTEKDIMKFEVDRIEFPAAIRNFILEKHGGKSAVYKLIGNKKVVYNGELYFNGIQIEPEDLEYFLNMKYFPNRLGWIQKFIEADRPVFGAPVEDVIDNLLSEAPVFRSDYAVPNKRKIITGRGTILIKKKSEIPEHLKGIVEWILYMNNDINLQPNKKVYVVLNGDECDARIYKQNRESVIKIGNSYYWYDKNLSVYVGDLGFRVKNECAEVVNYPSLDLPCKSEEGAS